MVVMRLVTVVAAQASRQPPPHTTFLSTTAIRKAAKQLSAVPCEIHILTLKKHKYYKLLYYFPRLYATRENDEGNRKGLFSYNNRE